MRRLRSVHRRMPSGIFISPIRSPISASIDGVMFSGGVGEYVYGREERDFGDMGRRLGHARPPAYRPGALPWPLLPAGECIRATALGASEYSVQLSRQYQLHLQSRRASAATQSAGAAAVLRMRRGRSIRAALAAAIRAHFTAFDLIEGETEVALALRWQGAPSYERIAAFAQGIRDGLAEHDRGARSRFTSCSTATSRRRSAPSSRRSCCVESEMLVIDGVLLRDFDYIDLGRMRMPSYTVPVTIKSLVFSEDPRVAGRSSAFTITRRNIIMAVMRIMTMLGTIIITLITRMSRARQAC